MSSRTSLGGLFGEIQNYILYFVCSEVLRPECTLPVTFTWQAPAPPWPWAGEVAVDGWEKLLRVKGWTASTQRNRFLASITQP